MPDQLTDLMAQIGPVITKYGPKLVAALAILFFGWLAAKIIGALIGAALKRTSIDNRIGAWILGDAQKAEEIKSERFVSKGVYYLLMLFVLMAFFQALGLTLLVQPINTLLDRVAGYAPQILGAAALLLIAWVIATVLRMAVTRFMSATAIDKRLGEETEDKKDIPLSETLGEVVYWVVFALFLPMVLSTLELSGLLEPVQGMMNKAMAFIPNLLGAVLIGVIGWFLARIVQRIVSNLLAAVGTDRLSERFGVASALGDLKLSALIGRLIYALILLPVLILALDTLQLTAVTRPASNMLNAIMDALPNIFTAVLVLLLAYFIGKVVGDLIANLLAGFGFNNVLVKLGVSTRADAGRKPSEIVGMLVIVAIMLFATIEAAGLLGFDMLSTLIAELMTFGARVVFGLVIFGLGLYLANLVASALKGSATAHAGLLAGLARVAILALVGAMALQHMGIANEIINLAFGLLLGAVAVAIALAFGLGSREIAAEHVSKWVGSMTSPAPTSKKK